MKIGVAYYPEHWPEERWSVDARMMREMGIDVVRMGEFAWSLLEPKRERFEMDWLEGAVEVLAEQGLTVILCTPTAAPPGWLFQRHPGMLPEDADGRRWHVGSRRHVCLNKPAYLKYARRIVTELAKRFGRNPHIYAWQVDNELGCHASGVCYCGACELALHHWLKRRYGTVERSNLKWGTAFWSQRFSDWQEVSAPRRTPAGPHPSLALDYQRFVSATYRSFLAEQREIIKQYASRDVIVTTNSAGPLSLAHINHFSLASAQDVAALDNYPADASRLEETALNLDLTRSLKRKPFWVLEQQAGATLLAGHASQPRPGQLRLWSYGAAARGAELISYFRWRTCNFGQEMHWYGILDADGTPRRRFAELKQTISELKERAQLWEGRLPQADVALLVDYDSAWALGATPLGLKLDYFAHLRTLYELLRGIGVQVDFVPPGGELADTRVLVVPMPFICTEQLAKQLEVYTYEGHRVLVTAPAGYKTQENTAAEGSPPNALTDLLGVEVVEHDVLGPDGANAVVLGEGGQSFPTGRFCSVIELRGAKAIGTYGGEFYAGSPAITSRAVGQGEAYFVGPTCVRECYGAILRRVLKEAGVRTCEWSSASVEVVPLKGSSDEQQIFVLNHSPEPVTLALPEGSSCKEMLTDRECSGTVTLQGYDVALLSM